MRDSTRISHHDLTPGLGDLIEAEQRSRTYYRRRDTFPVLCADGITRWRSADECVVLEGDDPAPPGPNASGEARPS
jgi:hypothetical protein